jgi:hypothetical protein
MSEPVDIVPREEAAGGAPAQVSAARLVFRFAVGGTGLLVEWMGSALRAIDELPTPVDAGPPRVETGAHVGRSVVVGALSSAMRWRPPPTQLGKAARSTGHATRRGLRMLARLPGAGVVQRRYGRAHDELAAQLRRWAEEGGREERAGRRLARLATPSFFELAVARLADSPELKTVIEEQSGGLAASSVTELRERSEAADSVVERVVRRVLGRRPAPAR